MIVSLSQGSKSKLTREVARVCEDYHFIANEFGKFDWTKIMNAISKEVNKSVKNNPEKLKNRIVKVELLPPKEIFDGKPCYFPFRITSCNNKRVNVSFAI